MPYIIETRTHIQNPPLRIENGEVQCCPHVVQAQVFWIGDKLGARCWSERIEGIPHFLLYGNWAQGVLNQELVTRMRLLQGILNARQA